MKLIIAEKPDQGMKLAAPFNYKRKKDYLEISPNDVFPNGAYLTWAIGHLCELVPPEEYNHSWKQWSMDTLPILPEKFQHQVTNGKRKQFNVVKSLLQHRDVTEIIIAGDAGREGELIVRTIISLSKITKPMKRLWISSLTPNAVRNGFTYLRSEAETKDLYFEALSRTCADWLVGINATRAYTLLLQQKGISDVFSAGRVQTPTLALIVNREKEIQNFKSEPFWEVIAEFEVNEKKYKGKWHKDGNSRLYEEKQANAVAYFCKQKPAVITDVEKERKEYKPPYLFNLSSLQATANKMYKFSPKKTLDIAQKLYVKGAVSYPRSDSSFVTKGEAKSFPEVLEKISKIKDYQNFFPLPVNSIINNKRFVNEKKVSDHYAIIPTEQVTDPAKLSTDEKMIYDLIVRRLIAAHYEQAIFDYTTVHTLVDQRASFVTKGKEQVQEGWRLVFKTNNQSENDHEEQHLPPLFEGENGVVEQVKVKNGKTQPPKRYTEGQLITLMKTAGKHVEDHELKNVLNNTEGLGTEATRAGIITVLKNRNYIEVKKNQVSPTEKGVLLVEAVGKSILASPEMTARWEQRLNEIGKGQASPKVFMEQVKKLSTKLIEDALQEAEIWSFSHINLEQIKTSSPFKKKTAQAVKKFGKCMMCEGAIIDKGKFYGCTNYPKTKCSFTISKKVLGKTISQANLEKLLNDGQTNVIKGFKKGGKTFEAALKWDAKEKNIKFLFHKHV